MANPVIIYRGDTFKGRIHLKMTDVQDPTTKKPYPIPSGSSIEMRFKNDPVVQPSGPVSLTSAASEVVISDFVNGIVDYEGPKTKSPALLLGADQAIDLIVTDSGGKVQTFEAAAVLEVRDRANG